MMEVCIACNDVLVFGVGFAYSTGNGKRERLFCGIANVSAVVGFQPAQKQSLVKLFGTSPWTLPSPHREHRGIQYALEVGTENGTTARDKY